MARQLQIAFVWHMHQPLYKDRASGRYMMPWVRAHATKDYGFLLDLLAEFPDHRQTFNLVPSLLEQIEDYAERGAEDRMLGLMRRAPATWDADERAYVLERGFDVHWPTMARPYPRYAELLARREGLRDMPMRHAAAAFAEQDLADLVTWFNLAWFGPHALAEDPVLAALVAKGAGFDAEDRARLDTRIGEALRRTIPAYRAAAEQGRVELTTSPYYHPILPLLCDVRSAREARPDLPLPGEPFAWQQDAVAQVRRGLAAFERWFGRRPRGMWPSEQAVSPAALATIAGEGVGWTISDEGVLGHTLGVRFGRDVHGVTPHASRLYRPWRVNTAAGPIAMVFRDVVLSDLIGFTYGRMPAADAAADLHGRLDRIRRLLPDGESYLVTIALDGENCWEHYERNGVPFLRAFYRRVAADPGLRLVTVSEHLEANPPRDELDAIHAGSWIGADFTTWIGDPTKNLAWEALARARAALEEARPALAGTPALDAALEELHVAEGSDWFWWYGEGHDSGQDELFDAQFRLHLRQLYACLGRPHPAELDAPIAPVAPALGAELVDWEAGAGQGAMHAAARTVRRVRLGLEGRALVLALEFADAFALQPGDELAVAFYHPGRTRVNSPLPFERDGAVGATAGFQFGHLARLLPAGREVVVAEAGEYGAWHEIGTVEAVASERGPTLALPLAWLDAEPGHELRMVVTLVREGRLLDVVPADEGIPIATPVLVSSPG